MKHSSAGRNVSWPLQCLAGAVITQPRQQSVRLLYVRLNLVLLRVVAAIRAAVSGGGVVGVAAHW